MLQRLHLVPVHDAAAPGVVVSDVAVLQAVLNAAVLQVATSVTCLFDVAFAVAVAA